MKRVLIADDTKNIRTLLKTCLELEEYEVLTASNGLEALDFFNKENLNLAFLDIKMPEISGTEVLRRIRNTGNDIPVIIITAFGTVKNAIECTKMGAVAYLQKPFTVDKVKSTLIEIQSLIEKDKSLKFKNNLITAKDFIDNGRLNDALEILKHALSIDPINPKIFLLLSQVYKDLGENENADKFKKTYEIFIS